MRISRSLTKQRHSSITLKQTANRSWFKLEDRHEIDVSERDSSVPVCLLLNELLENLFDPLEDFLLIERKRRFIGTFVSVRGNQFDEIDNEVNPREFPVAVQ